MPVVEIEKPAAPVPAQLPSRVWDVGLRIVLLAVMVVAGVAALPSAHPESSTSSQFLDQLKAGQVSSVRFMSNTDDVRWSTDWRTWYRASLQPPLPQLPAFPAVSTVGGESSQYGTSQTWLDNALAATGHRRVNYDVVNGSDRLVWVRQLPWHGLSAAAGGVALAALLLMLSRRDHRFGNRWAWFWVMATSPGLAVVLYLALEQSPLWWRGVRRPLPLRPAFLGGAGLLIAIAVKPAIALLSLLVSS